MWPWVPMCLFLTKGFRESAFLCLHVFLSVHMFISTLFSEGRTPRPYQTLLFMDGETELPGKGTTWQLRGGKKRRDRSMVTKFNVIWAPLEAPESTLCTGGTRDWLRGAAWPKRRKIVPCRKEASLMHCTGLRKHTPTWGEKEAEVAKKERVTQKTTIRLEPWNCTLES